MDIDKKIEEICDKIMPIFKKFPPIPQMFPIFYQKVREILNREDYAIIMNNLQKFNRILSQKMFKKHKKNPDRFRTIVPPRFAFTVIKKKPKMKRRKKKIDKKEYDMFVDITENKDNIHIVAEMSGVQKEDIKLSVYGDMLNIHTSDDAAKQYSRKIELPYDIDFQNISGRYKNGIFSVVLRKSDAKISDENMI